LATVIDSLVVLLGLDASNYKKGRETAEKETTETARKSKEAADAITKSLTEVGRTVASLFLGFESVSGFTKFLSGLNSGEAALGRTAANIGMSAHELNKWGNAVKLAGGDATDAQSAFSQLTEDFQKMTTTGEQSALLQFLRARSVNIRDANGNLRDQGEIFEELADKTAQYGRAYQQTMFKQVGISQGEINYLVQSKALREDQLRLAEKNNGVTEASIREAQQLQEYWRNVGIQIEAAGQKVLNVLTPAVRGAFTEVSKLMDEFKNTGGLDRVGQVMRVIGNIASAIGNSISFWVKTVNDSAIGKYFDFMFKLYGKGLDLLAPPTPGAAVAAPRNTGAATPQVSPDVGINYVPPAGSKAARFNNPGNILDKSGVERKYATLEEGRDALEKDLRVKMQRGLKTVDAIIDAYEGGDNVRNNIPAYTADVRNRLGKNELTEADIKQLALAISTHESGPGVARAAPAAGSTTTVEIDTINIHSASADPRAVAEQVPAAIQRKFSVTQADTGQS
jgi:hypothetical protein